LLACCFQTVVIWVSACSGEKRNEQEILVRKPEGKRPLGKKRCRREE
jgi:hypothetical protein